MKGELTSFFFLICCCQHHRKLQASRFSDGEWWRDSPIKIPSHQYRYCRRPAGCKWARAARAPSATSAAVASHGTSRAQAVAAIFIGEKASTSKFCKLLLQ